MVTTRTEQKVTNPVTQNVTANGSSMPVTGYCAVRSHGNRVSQPILSPVGTQVNMRSNLTAKDNELARVSALGVDCSTYEGQWAFRHG